MDKKDLPPPKKNIYKNTFKKNFKKRNESP